MATVYSHTSRQQGVEAKRSVPPGTLRTVITSQFIRNKTTAAAAGGEGKKNAAHATNRNAHGERMLRELFTEEQPGDVASFIQLMVMGVMGSLERIPPVSEIFIFFCVCINNFFKKLSKVAHL